MPSKVRLKNCALTSGIWTYLCGRVFSKSTCLHSLPTATMLGQGYIFTGVCDSVNVGGGVSAPRGVSAPGVSAPGGGVRGVCSWEVSAWGVSTLGVSALGGLLGGVSAPRRGLLRGWGGGVSLVGGMGLVETPPGRPLLQAVRILLECILVLACLWRNGRVLTKLCATHNTIDQSRVIWGPPFLSSSHPHEDLTIQDQPRS